MCKLADTSSVPPGVVRASIIVGAREDAVAVVLESCVSVYCAVDRAGTARDVALAKVERCLPLVPERLVIPSFNEGKKKEHFRQLEGVKRSLQCRVCSKLAVA